MKGAARHDSRGVVAMANKGANTNGSVLSVFYPAQVLVFTTFRRSQFYITFKPTPNLDKKHTVFGKLVGGEDVLDTLEKLPRKDGTERPVKPVKISEVVMYVAVTGGGNVAESYIVIKILSTTTKLGWRRNSQRKQRRRTQLTPGQSLQNRSQAMA